MTTISMPQLNVFGVIGWKNSGKTTLIVALVREFANRGFIVSTIKHAHCDFDIDVPGKDSHRHRTAGASEVIVASNARWALMHELRGEPAPTLDELLSRLGPCDLVLVEGFKGDPHPKIEVMLRNGPLIAEKDESIVAVAAKDGVSIPGRQAFDLGDVTGIADFITAACGLSHGKAT